MGHGTLLLISVLLLFAFSTVVLSEDCIYSLFVKTGDRFQAGTDSNISVSLSNVKGETIGIKNLESWGLMGPDHDYFERDNLDLFSGKRSCLNPPVCAIAITSDGKGDFAGWYVAYVELTISSVRANPVRNRFRVDRWLAVDEPPFELTAKVNNCRSKSANVLSATTASG